MVVFFSCPVGAARERVASTVVIASREGVGRIVVCTENIGSLLGM